MKTKTKYPIQNGSTVWFKDKWGKVHRGVAMKMAVSSVGVRFWVLVGTSYQWVEESQIC